MYFNNIIGHNSSKALLTKMVQDGHVGHALMFSGEEGSGNLPMAIAFAGYIFCDNPSQADRCGQCPSCKKMNVLGHPDLHFSFPIVKNKTSDTTKVYAKEFIDMVSAQPYMSLKEWEIKIASENKRSLISAADSAEIVQSLSLKSFNGGHKVLIIWHADKMNASAANKILKTLEEPSKKTVVILVVNSVEDMLPTIISRTQTVNCGKVSDEEIENWLIEKGQVSQDVAKNAARIAEGNFNLAQHIVNNDEQDTASYLTLFSEWMRACVKSNMFEALETSQKLASFSRDQQQYFLDYCLQFLHKSILHAFVGTDSARFDDKALSFANKFAPFMAKSDLEGFHDIFSNGHYMVSRNINPQLLFMKMSYDMMKIFSAPATRHKV